jgi:hypothetical protein
MNTGKPFDQQLDSVAEIYMLFVHIILAYRVLSGSAGLVFYLYHHIFHLFNELFKMKICALKFGDDSI